MDAERDTTDEFIVEQETLSPAMVAVIVQLEIDPELEYYTLR